MNGLVSPLRLTLLGFAALALIAGGLLTFGATETDDWFSWTIEPPLSAAALGAYYWGAMVLLLGAARAPDPAGARPIVYPVLVIAVVLLAVTLVHLDKFDLDTLFGIFWLCAYVVAPPLLTYGVLRQRATGGPEPAREPLPAPLRNLLALEGALLLAVSGVMLLAPETAADVWPWALTPLVSRVLGAFALGVALVALLIARERKRPVPGVGIAFALLGALQLLAVAVHGGDLGEDGLATGIYLAFWAAVVATGSYGAIAFRASSRS